MALALEVKCGNARAYIYDDYCNTISEEEKQERKRKVREIIGKVASSEGATERWLAHLEDKKNQPAVEYIWHTPA